MRASSHDGAGALSQPPRLKRESTKARIKSMRLCAIGERAEYTLRKEGAQALGIGLALDSSAGETGPGDTTDVADAVAAGRVVIFAVFADSAAAAVGMKPQTFLTAVNGQSTARMGLGEVQSLVREAAQASSDITLEVGRPVRRFDPPTLTPMEDNPQDSVGEDDGDLAF